MTDADFEAQGSDQELNGQRLQALATYREGLKAFPDSYILSRSAGRLLVGLKQLDAAIPLLTKALSRVSNDRESAYYLGLAQRDTSPLSARMALESAEQYGPHRAPSLFTLAAMASRDGNRAEALRLLSDAVQESPLAVRAGGMEVALLRAVGRVAEARQRLDVYRRIDPTSSLLRYETVCLGGRDDGLWAHLAADPERILELVVDYQRFALYDAALDVLIRSYPSGPEVVSEPGMPVPASYPLLAYYRGYIRSLTNETPAADYAAASAMPTTYVFPHRAESLAVLRDAVTRNPKDPTAHFLLGSLYLSGGMVDEAMKAWEAARALRPGIATLHRNMGFTLLQRGDVEQAIAAFREGTTHDPANEGIYTGLEAALSRGGRPAAERADALLGFPDQRKLPAALVYKLATALAEAGRFDEAERQFAGRFFPREEGGINVRQIWLDVRLRRALALAKGGDCRAAAGITSGLARPLAGLTFTQDGLEDILARKAFQDRLEVIRTICGSAARIQDADVPYGIGAWDADTYGNHRAVVRVDAASPAVRLHLPWRRWDQNPESRNLIVVHAATDRRIANVARPSITRESGDIVFEAPAAGAYFVYYLPYVGSGRSNYPTVTYPGRKPRRTLTGWPDTG
jgi:tetratricopeptide (TPR) repeat protein